MESFVALVATTMNAGTPLLLAALGIVISERSGVVNLGIEGMMLVAAVLGFTVVHWTEMPAVSEAHLLKPTARFS